MAESVTPTHELDVIAQRVRMDTRGDGVAAGVVAEHIVEDLTEAGFRLVPPGWEQVGDMKRDGVLFDICLIPSEARDG